MSAQFFSAFDGVWRLGVPEAVGEADGLRRRA